MNSSPSALTSRRVWMLVQFGAGVFVGLVALAWAMRGLDWQAVVQALTTARYAWVAVSVLCVIGVALGKTARWGALYGSSQPRATFRALFSVLMITQMVNVVIPIRIGELVRIGLMKQAGQPGATTLSTIAIEKSLDLIAAGLIAASLAALAVAPAWLRNWSGSVLLIGVTLVLGFVLMWYLRDWIERFLARVLSVRGWLPERWRVWFLRAVHSTLEAFGALTGLRWLSRVLSWTTGVWFLSLMTIVSLFAAFDLNLSVTAGLVLMLALSLSGIVPSPPAFVGVMQAIAVFVLGEFGVLPSVALGLGIVLNVVTVAPLILLGSLALWLRMISSIDLFRRRRGQP